MATFTSISQNASFPFKHFDPSSLNRTQLESKAKVTGHILRKERREEAIPTFGLLHQGIFLRQHVRKSIQTESCAGSEDDLCTIPPQTLHVQATGHIHNVEEMDSAMCDLFRAGHGTSTYDLPSGDDHYQLGRELLDEEGTDHITCVATSNSATNGSLHGSSRGKCLSRLWC
jgi:hypothetical protein